jgi:hemoglobin-like flavoprotein
MSPENQTLVRDSFAQVVPVATQAAALFYDRLFVLDPPVQAAWTEAYAILANLMIDAAAQ